MTASSLIRLTRNMSNSVRRERYEFARKVLLVSPCEARLASRSCAQMRLLADRFPSISVPPHLWQPLKAWGRRYPVEGA